MDSDYSTILKLDEDFKNGLGIINPFISGLRTQTYVRLCRLWIDKLIHCSPHERKLRNVYLEQLCRHAEQQVLGPPFNCPPNEGPLQVIPQQFMIKQGVILTRPSSEAETSSWGDVSDEDDITSTSCCSTVTWHANEPAPSNSAVRKVASSTSTGGDTSENSHQRHRFKRHPEVSLRSVIKHRHHMFGKGKQPPLNDSNDELPFKDCFDTPVRPKSSCSKTKGLKKSKFLSVNVSTKEHLKEAKVSGVVLRRKKSKIKPIRATEMVSVKKSEKVDKSKELVEMYNNSTNVNPDQCKIKELEAKIEELTNEKNTAQEQLNQEKVKVNEMNSEMESLKNEVLGLSDKLALVETMKETLEGEHKHAISGIMETVRLMLNRAENAINKNDQLEQLIVKMSNELKHREVIDAESFQQIQKDWLAKQKALEQEYIEKMKTANLQTVQSYESTINDLKKEVSKKNKDVMRLEKQLQEHCARMRVEVENIRCEMENSSKENAAQLNAKMNSYKMKVVKLLKYNKKIIENYEQKISALNKSKDMELWVQKLTIGSDSTNDKKQELESIVSALEEKFRKHLSEANQISLHRNEQKVKYTEVIAGLENEIMFKENEVL